MNARPRLSSRYACAAMALTTVGLCAAAPALAQDNAQGKVLFMLDSSGSMRAKIDKREKIAIAES
ncbi:MAG: hypothetical protein U1F68_00710 [Gammaproteobacteria bacterium]